MTWLLEPRDAGTMVTVTAEDVPPGVSPEDHQTGFADTLTNLARFVERTNERAHVLIESTRNT